MQLDRRALGNTCGNMDFDKLNVFQGLRFPHAIILLSSKIAPNCVIVILKDNSGDKPQIKRHLFLVCCHPTHLFLGEPNELLKLFSGKSLKGHSIQRYFTVNMPLLKIGNSFLFFFCFF